MMEQMPPYLMPVLSALAAWIATVATIKTDIHWIKQVLNQQDNAITRLHDRIDNTEKRA